MKCSECQKVIPDDSEFCPECGKNLKAGAPEAKSTGAPGGGKKKIILIAAGGLAAILVILLIVGRGGDEGLGEDYYEQPAEQYYEQPVEEYYEQPVEDYYAPEPAVSVGEWGKFTDQYGDTYEANVTRVHGDGFLDVDLYYENNFVESRTINLNEFRY